MKPHTRLVSLLAAGSLCALTLVASPAQATVSPSATAAGKWLAGELKNGLIIGDYGPSYGLTVDFLTALQETDTQWKAQDSMVSALSDDVLEYIGSSYDNADARYAGASAKLLVAVQSADKNPESFGGQDLVDVVERSVADDAGDVTYEVEVEGKPKEETKFLEKGQVSDVAPGQASKYGDYANMIGESFALRGLATAGSLEAQNVGDFVVSQQCDNGNFPLAFDGCGTPDVDTTALVVTALRSAKAQGVTGLEQARRNAVNWLDKQQQSDGSFGGGDPTTSASNANSTGLSAFALGNNGRLKSAQKAAKWIHKLQVTSNSGKKLQTDVGAIALNSEEFKTGQSTGITDVSRGTWDRATAQAALGLTYLEPSPKTKVVTKEKVVTNEKVVTKEIRSKPLVRHNTSKTVVTVTEPDTEVTSDKEATSKVGKLGQYLAGQLSRGDHLEVKAGDETYVDYDLTADTALALRQLGQQQKIAERTTQFLFDKKSIDAYAHGAPYEKDATYAEPLAKLLIIGHLAKDVDAKTLGKMADELADLQSKDGSFKDKGENADRSGGTEREALALTALQMSGKDTAAKKAGKFFEDSQCDDGGFAPILGVACKHGEAAATGWALQAMATGSSNELSNDSTLADAVKSSEGPTTAAAAKAVESLQSVVHLDGSVNDSDGDASVHDTAIVAGGLQAAGLDTHRTAKFLGAAQQKDGGVASTIGGAKSNMTASIVAAPAIAATSLAMMSNADLPAVLLSSSNPQMTAAKQSGNTNQADGIVIPRQVAYIGGAVLVALLIAVLAMAAIGFGRRGTQA